MSKEKFTKGEWKPIEHLYNGSFEVISSQSGDRIAYLNQGEHNAHLIAAATEMYEMLKGIAVSMECFHGVDTESILELLAKARGEL